MPENQLKKCSAFLIIREMQIKTTLRIHLISVRMANVCNKETAHAGKNAHPGKQSSIASRNANIYS